MKTAPSLVISKTVTSQADVEEGEAVTYTVTLQNDGESLASGVLLSDTLPSQVGFDHWLQQSGATLAAGNMISWTGTVTENDSITWSWVVTYAQSGGSVVNTAAYRYGSDTGSASATFGPAVQPIYLPVVVKKATLP
ncbi:MAG: DUF11 domain-containing protein [bacterium]|nr:DUF11 domain-containing protein [bacterium]